MYCVLFLFNIAVSFTLSTPGKAEISVIDYLLASAAIYLIQNANLDLFMPR